jgi:hypothetical protein
LEDIPGGVIGDGSQAFVFELDALLMASDSRQTRVTPKQNLDTLLIGGEKVFIRAQALTFPEASVQVQDDTSFGDEIRVSWEEPIAIRDQRADSKSASGKFITGIKG